MMIEVGFVRLLLIDFTFDVLEKDEVVGECRL
jgi:hypothetical protein